MTLHDLLVELRQAPLVASVQADPGTPLDHPDALVRLAQSSIAEGVRVLRLQGIENIKAIRKATGAPVVGLLKREFTPHHVYLTSTMLDVLALISAGCEGVSLDGTRRHRPEGDSLAKMIEAIHAHGRLAVADVDTLDSAHYAKECGADMLTTALAGYTDESVMTVGPDFGVLAAAATLGLPVFAEGRYSQRWHVEAAMRIGAASVVVGGALNDPLKQTRALSPTLPPKRPVGAVDLGGTWLRFALFDPSWKLLKMDRVETPATHAVRIEWVRSRAHGLGLAAVGISSGGTIDPRTGVVVESKGTIPDHAGHGFGDLGLDIPIRALNDGLATAWGHACHPAFAARRVATLALGTGVGCGFVAEQRIWMGPHGEYPRLNDLPLAGGCTVEEALGGSSADAEGALDAAREAVRVLEGLYFPERIVLAGSVGLGRLGEALARENPKVVGSPFGENAGLYGAAALALFPPPT